MRAERPVTLGVAVALAVAAALSSVPAGAQEEQEVVRAGTVVMVPEPGFHIEVGSRRYAGPLRVGGHAAGLALVEETDIDTYLAGIQEVPFSWEVEALEAQAIAARTYLAWTLAGGRSSDGERYDFDICATTACQVYAGVEPQLAEGGPRWVAAVEATGGEILVHDGRPAEALYSSTSGGRTRHAGDVWPGSEVPYLRAVDSPGEASALVDWVWSLHEADMAALLVEAGVASGNLLDIHTETTADGEGPWTVVVTSTGGTERIDTWTLRGQVNAAASRIMPDLLPATAPDGDRYPQTILSPTYTIARTTGIVPRDQGGVMLEVRYEVTGKGWGHLVGMSQYGAQAMAGAGATAPDILAHYYGGLRPVAAPELVPETVEVGLGVGQGEMRLTPTGPMTVTLDGDVVAEDEVGTWELAAAGGSVEVRPPAGLGLPPRIRFAGVSLRGLQPGLVVEISASATVEWQVSMDDRTVASFGPVAMNAGVIGLPLPIGDGPMTLSVRAENPHGGDTVTFEWPG